MKKITYRVLSLLLSLLIIFQISVFAEDTPLPATDNSQEASEGVKDQPLNEDTFERYIVEGMVDSVDKSYRYGINREDRKEGYKYQALYAYRLRFDFSAEGGTVLDYLRGKEVKLDPRSIWFVSEF